MIRSMLFLAVPDALLTSARRAHLYRVKHFPATEWWVTGIIKLQGSPAKQWDAISYNSERRRSNNR